jgi:SPP1 family predicted phage head-tail adaptor
LKAGRLIHRVIIQKNTPILSAGRSTDSWSQHAEAWVSIEPVSGAERFSGQQVQSNVSTKIVMRYLPTVTEKMRVRHVADIENNVVNLYDIEAVIHVQERRRETHLMCVKRGAEGFRSGT